MSGGVAWRRKRGGIRLGPPHGNRYNPGLQFSAEVSFQIPSFDLMVGQGRPHRSQPSRVAHVGRGTTRLVFLGLLLFASIGFAQDTELRVRIEWGGGTPQPWQGSIRVPDGHARLITRLGTRVDEAASIREAEGNLQILPSVATAYDGVDVEVSGPLTGAVTVELFAPQSAEPKTFDIPLKDVVSGVFHQPLDDRRNWLLVRRAPGDQLRLQMQRDSLVFSPGEKWSFDVRPHHLGLRNGTQVDFEFFLREPRGGAVLRRFPPQSHTLRPQNRMTLPVEIPIPPEEGTYELVITASLQKLRMAPIGRKWFRDVLAERVVQFAVIAPNSPDGTDLTESTVIQEIDPVHPGWWQRLGNLPVPGFRKEEMVHGPLEKREFTIGNATRAFAQLGPHEDPADPPWQAFPLSIRRVGAAHELEIEYPAEVEQTLGIAIIEPNAAGETPPQTLDTGVYNRKTPGKVGRHRVVFWPRTRAPVLLITGRRAGQPAYFGTIRVRQFAAAPPRLVAASKPGGRMLATYLGQPKFPDTLLATEALDGWSRRSLQDWQTFHQGSLRLADYLHHTGRNALFLTVASDGGSLYPSQTWAPTPRYDNGVLFASGQDPVRKDVLELVCRVFDREGIGLVPTLRFNAPLASLEQLRFGPEPVHVELIGESGRPAVDQLGVRGEAGPYYNPLHPETQNAIQRSVREVLKRYGRHGCLRGVAIDLDANGYTQFPGLAWPLDDQTVSRFESESDIRFSAHGEGRFADRKQELLANAELREKWIRWRSAQLAQFYRKLQADVAEFVPDGKLFLLTSNLLDGLQSQVEMRHTLPKGLPPVAVLQSVGIDPENYQAKDDQDAVPVLFRPQRVAVPGSLEGAGPLVEEWNTTPQLDELFQEMPVPASQSYHAPLDVSLPSFGDKSPFSSRLRLSTQTVPAGVQKRKRFARSLAAVDAQVICDGGEHLLVGGQGPAADFLKLYRALPAARFKTVANQTQPVVIRKYSDGEKTYVYLVNDSPWHVKVLLPLTIPAGGRVTELAGLPVPPIRTRGDRTVWEVDLEPFDLRGGLFTATDIEFGKPQVTPPPEIAAQLKSRIEQLSGRMVALTPLTRGQPDKVPFVVWNLAEHLENAGFETGATPREKVPGWKLQLPLQGEAEIDAENAHSGERSLRLNSVEATSTLATEKFAIGETGELLMLTWMRVRDESRQPRIRLVLEAQRGSETYYRFAPIGAGSPVKLTQRWRSYLFRVNDLPPLPGGDVQVRFELSGDGEVWIDDVQLSSVVLEPSEMIRLRNSVATARFALDAGRVADAYRLLQGYWPQLLIDEVPGQAVVAAPRQARIPPLQEPPRQEPPAPAQEDSASRWWDPWSWYK